MLAVDLQAQRGTFGLQVALSCPDHTGVLAIAGPSGAGKSSLLRCLAGLTRPDAGRIALGGEVVFDRAAGVDVPAHQRGLGVVFQDPRLFPHLTVRDNLCFGKTHSGPPELSLDAVVDRLGIGSLLSRRPRALSGGEARRVALGRALLSAPRMLLLDEPLSSLDPTRRAVLLPFLRALPERHGIPLVLVTHDLDTLLHLADQVGVLDRGQVVTAGTVADTAAALGLHPLEETLLDGTVAHADPDGLLLTVGGVALHLLPVPGTQAGDRLRVRVRSDDVVLAAGTPTGLSIRNRVPATVVALASHRGGVGVTLALGQPGGPHLAALVTRAARDELGLAPGAAVTALLKASALRTPR
jgi:molybdate transport system ATP-binding protein